MTHTELCDGNGPILAEIAASPVFCGVQILHSSVVFFTPRIRPFSAALVAAIDEVGSWFGAGTPKCLSLCQPASKSLQRKGFWVGGHTERHFSVPVAFLLTWVSFTT